VVVVDSSGWIEVFADGPLADGFLPHLADLTKVVTPVVVAYEVYWILKQRVGDDVALRAVAEMEETRPAPIDMTTAILAADFSVEHGLPMADALIYATARLARADLVTADQHFRGLRSVVLIEAHQV
jgi:predicted nucleic acid-binding protein